MFMYFDSPEVFKERFISKLLSSYGDTVESASNTKKYIVLQKLIRSEANIYANETKSRIAKQEAKELHYFSLEFLLGRMLANNLHHLGVYEMVEDVLKELNIDLNELIELEKDPGLGNGGLGRLAACFMDSLATLDYPGNGNTIRYRYGLFKQVIINNEQVEMPDNWLSIGNPLETRKPDEAVDVHYYGEVQVGVDEKGDLTFHLINPETVRAVPFDMPLLGQDTKTVNNLRMWSAEPTSDIPANTNVREYMAKVEDMCLNVYPDDSTEGGKILRIKQEYFFVSAGLQRIVLEHKRRYGTLDNFAAKHVIQLNDTHPALAIPELMRLLMDENGYTWDDAFKIVKKTFAYTNHTVMDEALEKWNLDYIKRLLPRIYMIIEELNHQYARYVLSLGYDQDFLESTAIIQNNHIHMANLSIIGSFSVNGVAKLHTSILEKDVFRKFYLLYPKKFNNKTNGITPRRFFLYTNPELKEMISNKIANPLRDLNVLKELEKHAYEKEYIDAFLEVKKARKEKLALFLKKEYDIDLDPNSMYDVIAKRLHAYKRQLLDIFYVISLYLKIKEDPSFEMTKTTFIFSAKAASGYYFAKKVIKLINCVAETIRNDEEVNKYINVVFIPNYRVTVSEVLMNAADVSEQISLAGKEASGTGNMKFMMNGALTLGTLDGANVEIRDLVGDDNIVIFGLKSDEVEALRANYRARDYYERDPEIKAIINSLIDGTFSSDKNDFLDIANEFLIRNDEYFILADFKAYKDAHRKVYEIYNDKASFASKCLINIAKSPYFSSDRTIEDYVADIWHLNKIR